MLKNKNQIIDMIFRYLTNNLTEEEKEELHSWKESNETNRLLFEKLTSNKTFIAKREMYRHVNTQHALKTFLQHTRKRRLSLHLKIVCRYAAIIIVLFTIGLILYPKKQAIETTSEKIETGSPKAVLLVSGGKSIQLQTQEHTTNELPSYVQIVDSNSQLIYNKKQDITTPKEYHELQVSRGGEYKLTLPDGTFVYLNSASTLKYPTCFDPDKREVHLSGEAYFEVAKDPNKPFYVITDNIQIKVYGTTFNVNTHDPDYTSTVLVQGKVGVSIVGKKEEIILNPSQLALFDKKQHKIDIQNINPQQYIAWKDGLFVFEEEPLEKIMDKLALWYDCQVFYTNQESRNIRFTGYLKRHEQIDKILKAIGSTVSVSFEIKGKTILVTSNEMK